MTPEQSVRQCAGCQTLIGRQEYFSWGSSSSFFVFKEGMWDTQISALLSSPTVTGRILLVIPHIPIIVPRICISPPSSAFDSPPAAPTPAVPRQVVGAAWARGHRWRAGGVPVAGSGRQGGRSRQWKRPFDNHLEGSSSEHYSKVV
jgi:hypothetical protein